MQLLLDTKNKLGECVLWCERKQALLWTDILGCKLFMLRFPEKVVSHWDMPERLASFALTDDEDRVLLGLASQLAWFNFSNQKITYLMTVEADLATTRINDGRCDRQGRFVFGTINEHPERAPIGHFYRLNHDLSLERLPLAAVAIANSICFSPDGAAMYYCDSLAKAIFCCNYNYSDQLDINPRLAINLQDQDGVPDGSIIDAQGFLWNAQWGGGRLTRYTPEGNIDRQIQLPVSQPTCLTFGGADLNTLFVTTATDELDDAQLQLQPYAGGLFQHQLSSVRGLPEQRFVIGKSV